ncbi:hypothetical protein D5086_017402 [Populus alba]|uniref:Uncharacterized protein n=1 Tax=Populus alba TaxID=43335 RepID=A0ACC4BWQ5_POPAL
MELSFSVLLGTKASSPEPPNEQLSSILSSSTDLLSGRPLLLELEYLFVKLCSCCSCSSNDCCCADGADSPLHCYYWCKGDGRTVVDKGNLLGLNIYTSSDAGSLLLEDWIVSTMMTGIYRYQRAWCRERCVHYSNMLFRPIRRSRGA